MNPYTFPHPLKIQKGISSARSDDTKSLKGVVLEWISPPGIPLNPPLSRNVKTNRGYHHPVTGALLCPAGLDWNDAESAFLLFHMLFTPLIPLFFSIREKLSSGEMPVHGDQWPMLVYADQEYDPKTLGRGCLEAVFLFGFACIFPFHLLSTQSRAGIQAHLYLAQFGRERGESDTIGQCSYPWHDSGHYRLPGLRSHPGTSGVGTLAIYH